jgi:Holliday junction resolvase RusA-like endonuclease
LVSALSSSTIDGHEHFPAPLEGAAFFEGVLQIDPVPCPRPRVTKAGVTYYPKRYTDYKKAIGLMLKQQWMSREPADFFYLSAEFYFAYPKSFPKRQREEAAPMRKRCDLDNLVKGLMDAMQDAGMIQDDRQLSAIDLSKHWTTGTSRIHFYLEAANAQ